MSKIPERVPPLHSFAHDGPDKGNVVTPVALSHIDTFSDRSGTPITDVSLDDEWDLVTESTVSDGVRTPSPEPTIFKGVKESIAECGFSKNSLNVIGKLFPAMESVQLLEDGAKLFTLKKDGIQTAKLKARIIGEIGTLSLSKEIRFYTEKKAIVIDSLNGASIQIDGMDVMKVSENDKGRVCIQMLNGSEVDTMEVSAMKGKLLSVVWK